MTISYVSVHNDTTKRKYQHMYVWEVSYCRVRWECKTLHLNAFSQEFILISKDDARMKNNPVSE